MEVTLKKSNKISRTYNKQVVKIKPYVSLNEKADILAKAYNSYLERVEESGGLVEIIAGLDADVQVLVLLASVPDLELPDEITYDELLGSGFIHFVLKEVVNYPDIRNSVHDLIRLFVISERIPDINEMAKAGVPGMQEGMDKEDLEMVTGIVKEMQDS